MAFVTWGLIIVAFAALALVGNTFTRRRYDQGWDAKVREWSSTGQYPPTVVRYYINTQIQDDDIVRMQAVGYTIVEQGNKWRYGVGWARRSLSITWSRNPQEFSL